MGADGTRGGFEALDSCVHCGFCLQACPTFLATGDEADSPRGRIELMRSLEAGRLAADDPDAATQAAAALVASAPGHPDASYLTGRAQLLAGRTSDAVNSLLNYGYGILYSQVWGAVLNAGLEPFAGFLHVDRPGKPSLVLDLVEEFRQPVVDRAVIAHLNLGEEVKLAQGMLEAETRKALVERVMNRLLTTETYQGKRYQVRSILQMQARRLASFLRGGGAYKAFSFKW